MTTLKKWVASLTLAFLATSSIFAQGISFEQGTWEEIKAKAKEENKPIFMDAYAVWCGPCKWLSANVFTDSEVGAFFNDKYISVKMDMEKGEGPDLAQQFHVQAYPTLLYFNPDGELVHQMVGAPDAKGLIQGAEDALDPNKQIFTLQKRYDEGERDPEFLYNYAMGLASSNQDATEAAMAYFETQKVEDLLDEGKFELLSMTLFDHTSEQFQFVAKNRKAFVDKVGEEAVAQYIETNFVYALGTSLEDQDVEALNEAINTFKKLTPQDAKYLEAKANYYFYSMDPDAGYKYMRTYLEKYCTAWDELNSAAWGFFEMESDVKKLKAALKWANRSIELDANWYNLDTKANLLHKLGQYEKAVEAAEQAIKKGQDAGMDTTETEVLLEDLKGHLKK